MSTSQIIIVSILALISIIQWARFIILAINQSSKSDILLAMLGSLPLVIFIFFTCLFINMNNKRIKTCPVYEEIHQTIYILKQK